MSSGRGGRLAAVASSALVLALQADAARAHAVVHPRSSTPGAYQKYVLRVPNERELPTVSVELEFSPEVRVVSFADVRGWELEVIRDNDARITRAVWTGTLEVDRFVEFPFVAVNPSAPTRLVWRAWQVYADGARVGWVGPEDSSTPASYTRIREADGGLDPALAVSLGALALSLSRSAWRCDSETLPLEAMERADSSRVACGDEPPSCGERRDGSARDRARGSPGNPPLNRSSTCRLLDTPHG